MNFLKSAKVYAELIKLGHTLFALPFALSALCLAYLCGHSMTTAQIFWTLMAFVAARSTAMGFNRVADADIDALNPRTRNRPSVDGRISIAEVKLFTAISALLFTASAFLINTLCFWLSFPALAVLIGYSYAKRFTFAAHYILGLALALAPTGAWIAAADALDSRILALSASLFFHIAGFDLVYSLQDMDFDIAHKLHSVPSRFGRKFTLALAGVSFAAAAAFLATVGVLFDLNRIYWICTAFIFALYANGEFAIVKYGGEKTALVFFYTNVAVSGLTLLGIASNLF